ncbi:adenylate/guanylate cyclase domain-containing protein [Bradyrhizobium sp. 195]|nr:adenylate/guanylate cyclase domain-containing protein [Bradyrhizobium sp. 195]
MGADEEGTLARLKAVRKAVVDPTIAAHRGRIVKTTGDGMLVEFASAVDAVRGAIEVQRSMAAHSAPFPQGQRIEVRIGIHVGDIIIDENDIFGDGVNIAARLESIAEPGGVCISDDAYRQVRGKVEVSCDDLGPQTLKNIAEPMRAWRLRIDKKADVLPSTKPLVEADQALSLPDKPSIAVLPFQNMSGDAEQEYFADGLVEDIITALSRFGSLFVIARNSSFTYKGGAVDIKQVGRELGARYVLEGSVRKAGARLRITGQLIDVANGAHVWADRFDGALDDIFDLQDKITLQVVGAIAPELDRSEMERASRKSTGNLDAITEYYRGLPRVHFPISHEKNDAAIGHFNNSMTLDPTFAPAFGGAAACIAWRRAFKWPRDDAQDNAQLLQLAQRVKELGTDDAFALYVIGFALFFCCADYDAGIEMVDRAIQSNPNLAGAYSSRGFLRVWDGQGDAAIADFEQAMRLSPRDPFTFNTMIGLAFGYCNAGRYEKAAAWADKSIRAFPPDYLSGWLVAVFCYVSAGRVEDARKLVAECVRLSSQWRRSTINEWEWNGVRQAELRKKMVEAFIEAGLPE